MECAIVEKVSRFIGTMNVNADDASCFHGIAKRKGVWYPNEPDAWANIEHTERIEVARVASQVVPAITKPASQLVLTEEFAHSVQWGCRVQLESVGSVKLVDVDYTIGPEGWRKFVNQYHGKSLSEVLREFPDAPSYSKPKLIELRVWRLVDAVTERVIRDKVASSRSDLFEELELRQYVTHLVQEFGVLWHRGRIILSQSLLKTLFPLFDQRFFKLSVVNA